MEQAYGGRPVLDGGVECDGYWPGSLRAQPLLHLVYVQRPAPAQKQWNLRFAVSACCLGVYPIACGYLGCPLSW